MPEVEPKQLDYLFPNTEALTITIEDTAIGFSEAIPQLFTALGHQLPRDWKPGGAIPAEPLEELVLQLSEPSMAMNEEGEEYPKANARVTYHPANPSATRLHSESFTFLATIGRDERNEIRWYIEEYFRWPTGAFTMRAQKVEKLLPQLGHNLCKAALADKSCNEPFQAWKSATGNHRFTVELVLPEEEMGQEDSNPEPKSAASNLLSLPWEVLHDKRGYLFQGANGVRVCRRLPNAFGGKDRQMELPIRVLLISPRPEVDEQGNAVGYFNHRSSALPMVQTMEKLGQAVVQLQLLQPPTFSAMKKALQKAEEAGEPYHIVHFDGHGSFNSETGKGALCFEHPDDIHKAAKRKMHLVYAHEFAAELRGYEIPLVYLDACHSAQSSADPQASVAASLLEQGVGSVIAMSHSVLVATAQRFVEAFYKALAQGKRISAAMLQAQKYLYDEDYRDKVMGAGKLCLKDWFVPVLFQDRKDPQLFSVKRGEAAQAFEEKSRKLQLGDLPEPTEHRFVGRSPELLYLERLLLNERYAVVRGAGGYSKTTLAIELVRWLIRSQRFDRAVFVSVEPHRMLNIQGLLDSIGKQLLPQYIVNIYGDDIDTALQPIIRELQDFPTLILLDNMESILPDLSDKQPEGVADPEELFSVCQKLLTGSKSSRIIFTSRETLSKPFALKKNTLELGRLSTTEAIELVADVMARNGWIPPEHDDARTPQEVIDLVEAVQCHPRALVQMAPYVAEGVKPTTDEMARILAELEQKNPGDRENSLYASVELSLRRLPDDIREKIRPLAVVYGGVDQYLLQQLLNVGNQELEEILSALLKVRLVQPIQLGYLNLHPSLSFTLKKYITEDHWTIYKSTWFNATIRLVGFLTQQLSRDTKKALNMAFFLFPNINAVLDEIEEKLQESTMDPEISMNTISQIESLLKPLNLSRAVLKTGRIRALASKQLMEWGHANFLHRKSEIEMLTEEGSYTAASTVAKALLSKFQELGDAAYPEADYDLAMAHLINGKIQNHLGLSKEGLGNCFQANERFKAIGESAERMVPVALYEMANSLMNIGHLNESISLYEESIHLANNQKSTRVVAVSMAQLGEIKRLQRRYTEAIVAHGNAREYFLSLREPLSVATSWRMEALVYQEQKQYEKAEYAFQKALLIFTQENDVGGQATCLGFLGNLYDLVYGRLQESLVFYEKCAALFKRLKNAQELGKAYNNIALVLLKMNRFDQARISAQKSIESRKDGPNEDLWKNYLLLFQIETILKKKHLHRIHGQRPGIYTWHIEREAIRHIL